MRRGTGIFRTLSATIGRICRSGVFGRLSSGRNQISGPTCVHPSARVGSLSSCFPLGEAFSESFVSALTNLAPMPDCRSRPGLTTRPNSGDNGDRKAEPPWLEMIWERPATMQDLAPSSRPRSLAAMRGCGPTLRLVWNRSRDQTTPERQPDMWQPSTSGGR